MESMPGVHDHDPNAFDDLLDTAPTSREPGNPDIAITVAVPMSSATLTSLTQRAAREGRDVADVVADALREAAA